MRFADLVYLAALTDCSLLIRITNNNHTHTHTLVHVIFFSSDSGSLFIVCQDWRKAASTASRWQPWRSMARGPAASGTRPRRRRTTWTVNTTADTHCSTIPSLGRLKPVRGGWASLFLWYLRGLALMMGESFVSNQWFRTRIKPANSCDFSKSTST